MIRVICSHCQAPLNAKESLLGQTRNCPNCGQPVEIRDSSPAPASGGTPSSLADTVLPPPAEEPAPAVVVSEGLPFHHWIERLNRHYQYLICDRTRLIATWQNNGDGWMIKTHAGMISASRNAAQIPSQGDFKLIELKLESGDGGRRLAGLAAYQLAERYALLNLERGDDAILEKVVGQSGLRSEQKIAVRAYIRERFMPDVWSDAKAVSEFLANADYHSPGVG